jgi:hypothetical protein
VGTPAELGLRLEEGVQLVLVPRLEQLLADARAPQGFRAGNAAKFFNMHVLQRTQKRSDRRAARPDDNYLIVHTAVTFPALAGI